MKNFFCQPCAAKAAWAFDVERAFRHACQRCFQMSNCNDYNFKLMQRGIHNTEAAPSQKQLVHDRGAHVDVQLPKASTPVTHAPIPVVVVNPEVFTAPTVPGVELKADPIVEPPPAPVVPVEEPKPAPVEAQAKPVVVDDGPKLEAPKTTKALTVDEILDRTQPNRPRITLEVKKR